MSFHCTLHACMCMHAWIGYVLKTLKLSRSCGLAVRFPPSQFAIAADTRILVTSESQEAAEALLPRCTSLPPLQRCVTLLGTLPPSRGLP